MRGSGKLRRQVEAMMGCANRIGRCYSFEALRAKALQAGTPQEGRIAAELFSVAPCSNIGDRRGSHP
jgi:hypothetical protein